MSIALEEIKKQLFNKMVSELKEPLPEGVYKICPAHGNLTLENAKLMPNGKDREGRQRYSLRCGKCLTEYRRTYEIKNSVMRSRAAREVNRIKRETLDKIGGGENERSN